MLGFIFGFLFASAIGCYAFYRTHDSIWDGGYSVGVSHGKGRLFLDPDRTTDVSPFDEGWSCGYSTGHDEGYELGYDDASAWAGRWKGIAKYYRAQRDGKLHE